MPIDCDNLDFQHKKSVVYYASEDLLIHSEYQKNELEIETTTGVDNGIRRMSVKKKREGKCCKTDKGIFLSFGDTSSFLVTPDDTQTITLAHPFVVTEAFSYGNKLIYGSLLGRLFHFVIHDLETGKKNQTESTQAVTLSCEVLDNEIYALYGNSHLVCYDFQGKIIWKKFEPYYVVPGLAFYKNRLIYSSDNHIKITDGKQTESIRLPGIKIDKVEEVNNNILYGICGTRKNLFAYDLRNKKLLYEVKGQEDPIKQCCVTKGFLKNEDKVSDVFFYSTKDRLGMVDLATGTLKFYIGIPRIKTIKANEELIVLTHLGESHLLRTRKKDASVTEL